MNIMFRSVLIYVWQQARHKKQAPSIYQNLKRTSTVSEEPKDEHKAQGDDVGKVKANIESSKIKQLIANMNKDN